MVETSYAEPWMNPLPCPYLVPYWRHTTDPDERDEVGNAEGSFDDPDPPGPDPVMQPVQGWDSVTKEDLDPHVTGETVSVILRVPTDFYPGIQDRIGLPIPDNGMVLPGTMWEPDGSISVGIFEVVGHITEGDAFHRWRLTNMVLLKRMSG